MAVEADFAAESTQDEEELLLRVKVDSRVISEERKLADDGAKAREGEDNRPKKTGKEKRKERRLKNEPQNFVGLGQGPSGVNVLDFAEARATELKSMLKALESKEGGKRLFQKLPRHMRRRAMSHNPKRLPRRMREMAAKEMDGEKVPSRRQRRKPRSLCKEYSKRQGDKKWLETHIWHAKRMKMTTKYGYRLAEHCCDKGIRAAHKSLVYGCLLSDLSYYCCYEVTGGQNAIIASLGPLFHNDTGLTIGAKAYLKGQREGKAILYKSGSYPYGAIAPVQFIWQATPLVDSEPGTSGGDGRNDEHKSQDKTIKLWIWCHPAAQMRVLSELQAAIELYQNGLQSKCFKPEVKDVHASISISNEVSVTTRNLNRFRLIGPRSHALLMETLKPILDTEVSGDGINSECVETPSECKLSESNEMDTEEITLPHTEKWWSGDVVAQQLTMHSDVLSKEYPLIKSVTGPAQFSCGTVIGLCIQDPRLYTPSKKTDMVSSYYPPKTKNVWPINIAEHKGEDQGSKEEMNTSFQINSISSSFPPEVAFSLIWDPSICNSVLKIPDHLLNLKRSEKFIKSSVLNLGDSSTRIPVMLIQQSSQSSTNALGAGWDLVLPPEWAMPFWVSLVHRGARVCGMKELQKCSLESQTLHFPQDFPDTGAGQQHNSEERRELEAKYLKKPPDKRCNYGKILVPTPFHSPWDSLVQYWSKVHLSGYGIRGIKRPMEATEIGVPCKKPKLESNGGEWMEDEAQEIDIKSDLLIDSNDDSPPAFYVLRSRKDLTSLKLFLKSVFAKPVSSQPIPQSSALQVLMQEYCIGSLLQKHSAALVAVRIELQRSGSLSVFDSLSLPLPSDLSSLLNPLEHSHPFTGPTEKMNQRGVTIVGNETVVIGISSLTRKRMKDVKRKKKGTSEYINDFRLYPAKPSRLTIGYVTSAGYCLTTSRNSGLGFVTLQGLMEAVNCCYSSGVSNLLLLARGAKTKYYFVKLHIF